MDSLYGLPEIDSELLSSGSYRLNPLAAIKVVVYSTPLAVAMLHRPIMTDVPSERGYTCSAATAAVHNAVHLAAAWRTSGSGAARACAGSTILPKSGSYRLLCARERPLRPRDPTVTP
jgi:hypothetical protein